MAAKTAKGYKGIGMDGFVATWYAKNTRKVIEEYRQDARKVAGSVSPGSAVLELAPGPGYLAIELAKLSSYQIAGLDISETFVEIARTNAEEAGVEIDFRQGNASQMPFDGDTFDFIVCRSAFKNFAEPVAALDEMYRVLKAGGKALILDLRGDVSQEAIDGYVKHMGLNRLNSFLNRWAFKLMLVRRAYTKASFTELASKSRFKTCEIQENLMGLEVWLEK